jgi:lipoprotein-anchoring transpeptidase ErfK/SrfK
VLAAALGGPVVVSDAAQAPAAAAIEPSSGQVVGIGAPAVVRFSAPVADRAAAERGIHITSSRPTPAGRFTWVSDEAVQWIPDGFWPAHTSVTVRAGGLSSGFEIGDAVTAVASISAHTFTVSMNEQIMRQMPASMGKPKRPTPIGSFSALSKERTVTFDSRTIDIPLSDPDGYYLEGQYAVRVTWSGVYVHSAPWSVDSQGYSNVSHGCINLSPDDAAWYFETVNLGDPIIVQA